MPETLTVLSTSDATPAAAWVEAAAERVHNDVSDAGDAANATSMAEVATAEVATPEMPRPLRREPRPCAGDDPIVALVYRALDTSFDALQSELPRVWREDTASGVHRMRMATRRTRAVLRTFGDILPRQQTRTLAEEAKWLAGELGRVRDLDVHLATLERSRELLAPQSRVDLGPYLAETVNQRSAAHLGLLRSLAGEQFTRLTADFASYLEHGPSAAALRRARGLSASEGAERFALLALKRARKAGRKVGQDAPPERLHKVRLRCKRLRYLLEAFEPIYGERLQGAVKALKRVQDALGEERDLSTAVERLRAYAAMPADPDATGEANEERKLCQAACLELVRLQEREVIRTRRRFERAWKQFEERVRKRKLRRILRRPQRAAAISSA